MEILKHGDLSRFEPQKYFVCYNCGCEFKAKKSEYKMKGHWKISINTGNMVRYEIPCCKCPCCGNDVNSTVN